MRRVKEAETEALTLLTNPHLVGGAFANVISSVNFLQRQDSPPLACVSALTPVVTSNSGTQTPSFEHV
jgi:hypothetical protein